MKRGGIAFLAAMLVALGQVEPGGPLPVWPEDGRLPEALGDRYVFISADGHALVLRIPTDAEAGLAGPVRLVRMPLFNELAPALSVAVARGESGEFVYRYEVRNAQSAKDSIGYWSLIVPAGVYPLELIRPDRGPVRLNVQGHPGAPPLARHPLFPEMPLGRYLGMWHREQGEPVAPGGRLGGFELYSTYEPGLTTALFSAGRAPTVDPSWPVEVRSVALPQWWNRSEVFLLTIGPMFPPRTDAEQKAARLRGQIADLLRAGRLSRSSPLVEATERLLSRLVPRTEPAELNAPPGDETERAVAEAVRWVWRSR